MRERNVFERGSKTLKKSSVTTFVQENSLKVGETNWGSKTMGGGVNAHLAHPWHCQLCEPTGYQTGRYELELDQRMCSNRHKAYLLLVCSNVYL